MAYRIGIYDPAFKEKGHFIAFNAYIASLIDAQDTSVVFFDQTGLMRSKYADLPLTHALEFIDLPQPTQFPYLGRLGRILGRIQGWRMVFAQIRSSKIDFLLITAEARDPLMYLESVGIRYGIFLLYPYSYFAKEYQPSFLRTISETLFRRFVAKADLRLSTSEPPILADIKHRLGMNDIEWIPNMPTVASSYVSNREDIDFLTLGTISKSKNHLFALETLAQADLPVKYCVAGAPLDETGLEVQRFVENFNQKSLLSLEGTFGYLSEHAYADLLSRASFMLFPYDFTRGRISSQVLHDCLSSGTPFIAPNIQPFKWYVEKYDIGLLYSEGSATSLIKALKEARERGPKAFRKNFRKVQQDHSLASIKERFSGVLKSALQRS